MCGIVAILNVDLENQVHEPLLRQMTDTMAHRGPDDRGYWINGPVGLGQRRLAILDLSPAGHQPMSNEDGTLWITYNGEIYNFQELREVLEGRGHSFKSRTDTEVILHAYEEWGTECLSRFNGMWAFALWDGRHRCLFIARDRFGVKPLVYYQDHRRFICASELKGILADRTVPREINPEALHHYLSLATIPTPFTIYKGIRKLRPGHYLLLKEGCLEDRAYWDLPMTEENVEDKSTALEHLDTLLQDAVNRRMISDVPVGVFLSGGLDSSLVAVFASEQVGAAPLRTFTVSFGGLKEYDESLWSQTMANQIHSNHLKIELPFDFVRTLPGLVRFYDEPFAISSGIALYLMAQEVSKHVKVVLTGDGADEVFAGYPWRHSVLDQYLDWFNLWPCRGLNEKIGREPVPLIRWKNTLSRIRIRQILDALRYDNQTIRQWMYLQSLYCYNEAEKKELYHPDWAQHVGTINTDELLLAHLPKKAPNRLARWISLDLKTTLSDEMLAKVDKATMAFGLEARVPFVDYRLVEYAINLPVFMKVHRREGKRILRWLGERYLPKEILNRPKHGFNVPLNVWFRNELWDFVNDILSESSVRNAGYFKPSTVREILQRHRRDTTSDFSNPIFALLCFELWRRG